MKQHRWTTSELKYVTLMYEVTTTKVIAEQMGVSVMAVRQLLFRNGIKKPNRKQYEAHLLDAQANHYEVIGF